MFTFPSSPHSAGGELDAVERVLVTAADIVGCCLSAPVIDTLGKHTFDGVNGKSWQMEPLNTVGRGAYGPMPKVKPIVLQADALTIFDCSDPVTTPMWMNFDNAAAQGILARTGTLGGVAHACTTFLDGIMYVGNNGANGAGLYRVDFINDQADTIYTSNSAAYAGDISERNTGAGFTADATLPVIVHEKVNDVAATVLPGAEMDESRELPYQTVAVATAGGLSVINPTGTRADKDKVVNITGQVSEILHVDFTADSRLVATGKYSNQIQIFDIPETDIAETAYAEQYNYATAPSIKGGPGASNDKVVGLVATETDAVLLATDDVNGNGGFTALFREPDAPTTGMVFHLTNDYASGCIVGDTTYCLMADTSTGSVTAAQPINNDGFDVDLTNWTVDLNGSDGGSVSVVAGQLVIQQGANSVWMGVFQTIDVTGIDTLQLSVDRVAKTAASNALRVGLHTVSAFATAPDLGFIQSSVVEVAKKTFDVSGLNSVTVVIAEGSVAGGSSTMEYARADAVIRDHSGNESAAVITGALTKAAVAAGAEAVAYGPFDDGNFPYIPHSSDLEYGTGDFWHKVSVKTDEVTGVLASYDDGTTRAWVLSVYTVGWLKFKVASADINAYVPINDGNWHRVVVGRKSGIGYVYFDGKLVASGAAAGNVSLANAILRFGSDPIGGLGTLDQGAMAFIAGGSGCPTADQVQLMDQLEAGMFKPGGTASLGTTSPISAIAQDASKSRFYVGTAGSGVIVLDARTLQVLEVIDTNNSAITSNTITALDAANGDLLITTAAEALIRMPSYRLREIVACA